MTNRILSAGLVAAALLCAWPALARVDVRYVQPERFSDSDMRSSGSRAGIMSTFDRHFDKLGARYLKHNQTLRIDVLNIRLAGHTEPWQRQFSNVRILRDSTPPRFRLRYTLTEGGRVLMQGEETITDTAYLMHSARIGSGRYEHEKEMLRDWFRNRFVKLRPPRT